MSTPKCCGEVVSSEAAGKSFFYCRNCKQEVGGRPVPYVGVDLAANSMYAAPPLAKRQGVSGATIPNSPPSSVTASPMFLIECAVDAFIFKYNRHPTEVLLSVQLGTKVQAAVLPPKLKGLIVSSSGGVAEGEILVGDGGSIHIYRYPVYRYPVPTPSNSMQGVGSHTPACTCPHCLSVMTGNTPEYDLSQNMFQAIQNFFNTYGLNPAKLKMHPDNVYLWLKYKGVIPNGLVGINLDPSPNLDLDEIYTVAPAGMVGPNGAPYVYQYKMTVVP